LIISCDYGKDINQIIKELKVDFFSLEELLKKREYWNNYSLDVLFRKFYSIRTTTSNAVKSFLNDMYIIPYAASKELEIISNEKNDTLKILSPSSYLKNKFDSKLIIKRICHDIESPSIPGGIFALSNLKFSYITGMFGCPFVLQFPIGSNGDNTFLVSDESYLKDIINRTTFREVLITKYINGLSPNINCVVSNNEVILSFPSIQLIGIEETTTNRFGYGGNDFSAASNLNDYFLKEIYTKSSKIGRWLYSNGYLGMFGIDFICDNQNNIVYPIDINPRFQGSTDFLSQLQLQNNLLPLPLYHIGIFLNKNEKILNINNESSLKYIKSLSGSQINLHNIHKNKYCINNIDPGVYCIEKGRLKFLRNGISVFDCQNSDEFVITCGVPYNDIFIQPDALIFKIQTQCSVLNSDSTALNKKYKEICALINQELLYEEI
jgi:hypothetical protein